MSGPLASPHEGRTDPVQPAATGAAPERLLVHASAELKSIPALRRQVVAYAERLGADEAVHEAVQLAVSEAVSNAVVHAYSNRAAGDVTVEARVHDDHQLVVVVTDDGQGLHPTPASPGSRMGIGLMAQVAQSFLIGSREGQPGTKVVLGFNLSHL